MQVRSVLALAVCISALAALPVHGAEKSALAGNTGLSINGSGTLNLVTSVPIGYLNRSVANGRRVINLRVGQPLLCADFAVAPGSGVNPVALQYLDPNGDSSGLLFAGISSYDYVTNGGASSLFKITSDARLACCVMLPAANANCFQGITGGSGSDGLFGSGFENLPSSAAAKTGLGGPADLAVSVSGPASVAPGVSFNYTITVTNTGGTSVNGVRVRDWFPKSGGGFPAPLASGTWSCAASGGASCGVANGAGNLSLNGVSLDPGASVTVSAARTMSAAAPNGTQFSVSAAAFAPPEAAETQLGNNQGFLAASVQQTSLSINDVTLAEGNAGTTNFQFTITRSNTAGAVSVVVNTQNGTAVSTSDYTAISNLTVNFAPGSSTAVVNVSVIGDTAVEANETFSVNLSNPSGAAITDGQGIGTITNDDSTSISIGDVAVTEGNSGTTNASFTVTLAGAVQGGFTVPVSSVNGSAIAPSDYTAVAGGASLTFTGNAGETRQVTVAVVGDTIVEANETFEVQLGTPSVAGVSVSDGTGVGTINNDDSASVAIGDVSVTEGTGGSNNAVFTVTLTGEVQGGFTLPVSSVNGSATAGSDYTAIAGGTALSFTGASGQTRTVNVPIATDSIVEINETFEVLLGAPSVANVSVSDGTGVGTINNDDTATVAINDVSVVEGNTGTVNAVFTVTLTGEVQDGFNLAYSSTDGTATAPSDYAAVPGGSSISFTGANGQTRTISVVVNGDTLIEPNETFFVQLGAASVAGVSASDGSGIGTITNDDAATIAINNVSVVEGNSGTVNAVFTVTLTGDVQGGFSVTAASANVTATAPSDYTAVATTLNFAGTDGETETVTVVVNGDTDVEIDEFFVVNLGIPSASSVTVIGGGGTGVGTIQNDDGL